MTKQTQCFLITGASSGIGYETALALSKLPQTKVIAIARNGEKLAKLLMAGEDKILPFVFDLETDDPVLLLDFFAEAGILSIDGIVHNAGYLISNAFEKITRAELEKSYRVNVFAPYLITQALLPLLKKSTRAHVVHISSMGGVQGSAKFAGLSAYSSAKGALSILTECLSEELKEHKIVVNCLALGAVQTEMLTLAFPGFKAPLQPHEMAEFVSWFIVNGQRFFNGKILPVAVTTP